MKKHVWQRVQQLSLVVLGIILVSCATLAPARTSGPTAPRTATINVSPSASISSPTSPSPTPVTSTEPLPSATELAPVSPQPTREVARGWPNTGANPPGTYSWNEGCAGYYCTTGFMHNGYGSGDVQIHVGFVPEGAIPGEGATPATVAGYEGNYRRLDAGREEWLVDIQGTTIAITLEARPGTSKADLADAHGIIESMRTQPRYSSGFALLFTLTNGDWDSG